MAVVVDLDRAVEPGDDLERPFRAVVARLDGPIEVDYYRHGGILPAVLRRLAGSSGQARPDPASRRRTAGRIPPWR